MIIQNPIQQALHLKKYWVLAGLFYFIHYIYQTLQHVISSFFILYKMPWITKLFSPEDQVKISDENFLNLKLWECYLRGTNKWLDKWQEVIPNNSKYTIDWT